MSRRMLFVAALVGAMAVAAGVYGAVSPFKSAEASSVAPSSPPSAVDGLLAEMAPGAKVEKHADGSVSVTGQVSSTVRAEIDRAEVLATVYPTSIRCGTTTGPAVQCDTISVSDLERALRAGEPNLYLRVIRRAITQDAIDREAPMFAATELVCSAPQPGEALSCTHVDRVQPEIAAGETLFVSYTPYNVTFDAEGHMINHLTAQLVVPLAREK